LTEAVRMVTRVIGQVQISAGGLYVLGCHGAWRPRYRRSVLAGRYGELDRAKAAGAAGIARRKIAPEDIDSPPPDLRKCKKRRAKDLQ
jgi:hypothetical protein